MTAGFVPRSLAQVELEGWPSGLPDHVSASQLKMYGRCPEQYRQRYVLGKKQRPGAALVWGGADHEAIEGHFALQLATGTGMTTEDVRLLFAQKLDDRIEADGGPGEIEWVRGEVLTGGDAVKAAAEVKDNGVKLVSLYHTDVAPSVVPLSVERGFEIDPKVWNLPVPIVGYIDLEGMVPGPTGEVEMTPDGLDVKRVERIVERKTAAQKKKALSNPEWVTQSRLYQLDRPIEVEFQLSLKPGARRKTPGVVANDPSLIVPPLPQAMLASYVRRVMLAMAHSYTTYGPDEPWEGSFAGFASSCDFCGFKPDCPWWSSEPFTERIFR